MSDTIIRYPGKNFREFFNQELAKYKNAAKNNPDDASVQFGLSESYINLWCYGFLSRDESLPKAKATAIKAVEIDKNLGMAHTVLGIIKLTDWDWAGAEQEFKLAIELDPDQYKSHHWYALYLSAMGRHEEAINESKKSAGLAPPSVSKIGYGSILYFAHEFEQMAEILEKAIVDEPDFAPVYDWLGMAYVQLNEYDKTIEVYRKAVSLSDGLAEINAGLGHAYGMAGRTSEAKKVLDELLAYAKRWYVPPVQIAFVCLSLGEKDQAFELLEKAYKERSWELVFMREEPWLDDLHTEARFVELMNRLQFPPK